ncbi:MAG: EAL domain-containing protein [Sulfurimonas sp.]|nr:EAL domain-containing protein [Sulfurimonas sp.]
MLSIQRFTLLIFVVVSVIFYALFTYYFFKQEEEMAAVIMKTLRNNIAETAYTVAKNTKNKESVITSRAALDRIAASNHFIKAILVLDDKDILLNTDPHCGMDALSLGDDEEKIPAKQLLKSKSLEQEIRFYEGKNAVKLTLVYVLEHEEIDAHFINNQIEFALYFGFIPIFIFLLVLWFIHFFVSIPLEKLRQFAYYHSKVPSAFKLKELEVIRYSMVDTFTRLESEKEELYLMARTDSLSGLANRNSLYEFVERLIAVSARNEDEFAFLFLDIDHFKSVNDSLGHNVGDELLKNIASIIKKTLRPNDFIARVGGDEFVLIIPEYKSYFELSNIIERIQAHLARPWVVQTHPIHINSSVGVAFYPKDATDYVSLMKHADIAMYEAKKLGRAQYHFFTEALNKSVQDTITLNKNMRQALHNGEYQLYYQPKVDILSGTIVGVEALLRWISPKKGIISPDVFIPLAEDNGFIVELGEWIVEEALSQCLEWKAKNIDINISINISIKQLQETNFAMNFIAKLEEKNVDPSQIDIEITEYILVDQHNESLNSLNLLHDKGISISLDDFGTGYSSLSYLKRFPIDYLKIDRSFMDDYDSEDGAIFIETIVKMGQTLHLKIIAEGVEKQTQLEYLKNIGCDQYQGYYYSKPLSVSDFEIFYKAMNLSSVS